MFRAFVWTESKQSTPQGSEKEDPTVWLWMQITKTWKALNLKRRQTTEEFWTGRQEEVSAPCWAQPPKQVTQGFPGASQLGLKETQESWGRRESWPCTLSCCWKGNRSGRLGREQFYCLQAQSGSLAPTPFRTWAIFSIRKPRTWEVMQLTVGTILGSLGLQQLEAGFVFLAKDWSQAAAGRALNPGH